MGCVSSIQAQAMAKLEEKARENQKKQNGTPPDMGSFIFREGYGEIGVVVEIDEEAGKFKYKEIVPSGYESWAKYAKDWCYVKDKPEFAPYVDCEFKVTAPFRGSNCNGYIMDERDGEIRVKFRPDAAHAKVDKTDWELGCGEWLKPDKITPGHTGDERPRNRTEAEIQEEVNALRGYGVACQHCYGCGQSIAKDPCDCYLNKSGKGGHCVECGKKAVKCCGRAVANGPQNQGYVNVLGRQYGHFGG
eukprot:GFYU01001352.1.p1 GENE.GFYU01001352.1~~GFYU01001352.1.p1  ORF type:complete len:247 (+),score=43.72 GFYU01001352.1:93-833(+)